MFGNVDHVANAQPFSEWSLALCVEGHLRQTPLSAPLWTKESRDKYHADRFGHCCLHIHWFSSSMFRRLTHVHRWRQYCQGDRLLWW